MANNLYNAHLERLFSINKKGGMKLGLENSWALSVALFEPHNKFRSIHVAGSNGKGSVTTKIAAALQSCGYRTGLYTSPHISSFRERIKINGIMILEEDVIKWLTKIYKVMDDLNIPATFFEVTTLLCFAYFAEQNVDFAVVETGIGGRLDATNIISPELSIITSISLEHTDILGSDIATIAKEKAGIIKPFTPVIIGPNVPENVILPIASNLNSPCTIVKGNFKDYHAENNAIARAALQTLNVTEANIAIGLKTTPPCRSEIVEKVNSTGIKKQFILDVAHNPDGFQNLLKFLELKYPQNPLTFVVGLSSNKDIKECLKVIKNRALYFYLVESDGERATPKSELKQCLIDIGTSENKIHIEPTTKMTISSLLEKQGHEIIVVCGSFFIMKDVRNALHLIDETDQLNLNEAIVKKT